MATIPPIATRSAPKELLSHSTPDLIKVVLKRLSEDEPEPEKLPSISGATITQDAPLERLSYSQTEVEKLLGVSGTTVWRLRSKGLLIPIANLGRPRFAVAELARFVSGTPIATRKAGSK